MDCKSLFKILRSTRIRKDSMKRFAWGLLDIPIAMLLGLCTALPNSAMAEPGYADRTDSVDEKLRQMRQAYDDGRLDLALSLAESIKWTLEYERQSQAPTPQLAADEVFSIDRLPLSWAAWARGWRYGRALILSELAGIERLSEPVDLTVAFPATQAQDPYREVRVVRVDEEAGTCLRIDGIHDVILRHTWNPPWTAARMTDAGRKALVSTTEICRRAEVMQYG
jgi:hypothetical protein